MSNAFSADVFSGHEPCPSCQSRGRDRSGNNLGRWKDGHAHCFSCGYKEPPKTESIIGDLIKETIINLDDKSQVEEKVKALIKLPEDSTKTIDSQALNWLAKYGIIRQEIIDNNLLWSPMYQQLIFPLYSSSKDPKTLLGYIGRNFAVGAKKYFSQGDLSNITHIIGYENLSDAPLTIVEDAVSAIKVGRHTPTMPLFGSTLSLQRLARIRYLTKKVLMWLDADKYMEAMKIARRFELVGVECRCIYTEHDPKFYNDESIKRAVWTS